MEPIQATKQDLLSTTVEHIDITKHNTVALVDAMSKMAYSARDLARAARRSRARYMMAENYIYMRPNVLVRELARQEAEYRERYGYLVLDGRALSEDSLAFRARRSACT